MALAANSSYANYSVVVVAVGLGALVIYKWKKRSAREAALVGFGATRMDTMDGQEFEHLLEAVFKRLGYKVEQLAHSGDFGADLIIEKDGVRTAVQAKRYGSAVGNAAVQQAYAASAHYKADTAWVVTNSTFTKAAKKQANGSGVRLVDRNGLLDLIARAGSVQ